MPSNFVKDVIDAFSKIKEEIDEKRGELDFRHSLADYVLKNVLEWGRKKGEGHFDIREREDIRLFDDSNRCVALIETKNPNIDLKDAHRAELKEHLNDYKGVAQYGALTNGHVFQLFEYTSDGELNELVTIDIDAFVKKGAEALLKAERQKIHMLRRLTKDRFVGAADPEYFRKTVQTIKVDDPQKFNIFIDELRALLNDLTENIERFFKFYWEAGPDHYGGKFLREDAFLRWKGASTGEEEELREKFCRETAYVVLNRILFTRILEDKAILTPRMISGKEFAQSLTMFGEGAYETVLKQAYKNVEKFYEHFYEFGIFDWWRLPEEKRGMLSQEEKKVQKEIEDEFNGVVIRDILKSLNQFDFRKVGRDILGDVYQEYLPPAERKQLGEFYTPVEVVRYILDAVGYTPENRIEGKLLLDPACGSGTFLVEASKRLVERYAEKLQNPLLPDNAKVIIEGIVSNIHGLDINPFACHIAEMNLLFNIIDYLHAVHSRDKNYRLPRFNICCTDSLMPPEMEATPITEYITNGRIRSHMEEAKRAMGIKKKQFDFVVGNPPYVRKESISTNYKENVLKKCFPEIYHGDNDLYVYFIGGGIKWLKEDGHFGYIVSRKFTKTRYGEALRGYIPETSVVKQYVDFGDTGVFKDATNYPSILILRKDADASKIDNYVNAIVVKKEKETGEELLKYIQKNIEKKRYSDNYIDIFETKQSSLGKAEWKFVSARVQEVLARIKEDSSSLKDVFDVFYGIKTGINEVFVVNEETVGKLNLEKEVLKPVLRGEDIKRYRLVNPRLHLVFITKNVDVKAYPNVEKYILRFKDKLEKRPPVRYGRIKWYEIESQKRAFETEEKLMTPDISDKNNFTYDAKQYYCLDTGFAIIPKKAEYKQQIKYFLGLLNSKTMEFYFQQISTHVRGMYYRYKKEYLEPLPIRLPQTPKEKRIANLITEKANQILQLNKCSDELEEKIEKFPESYFSGEKLVKAAEECKLTKDKYDTKSLVVESVKKAGKELYRLTLTKDDYILFSSRAVAECALEQLKRKNRVRIEEIHELKVPSEKDALKVMDEFSGDKKRVDEIKKEVEKLEGEIDELVYELYGLDAKDREVIEEFLRKF